MSPEYRALKSIEHEHAYVAMRQAYTKDLARTLVSKTVYSVIISGVLDAVMVPLAGWEFSWDTFAATLALAVGTGAAIDAARLYWNKFWMNYHASLEAWPKIIN